MFEELEQIPWSELVNKPKRPHPGAIAMVAVLVIVGIVLFRSRQVPDPIPPAHVSATAPVSTVVPIPTTDAVISEADLQAVDGTGELLALGGAVVEVRTTSTPDHYVEWAVAEGLTSIREDLWSVRVAFQVLFRGERGVERSAVRRVDVPIEVIDGRWRRVGPISVSDYEPGAATDLWRVEPVAVTSDLAESVRSALAGWDDYVIQSAGSADDRVRVLIDVAGMTLAVWLSGNGEAASVSPPLPPGS